MTYSKIYHASFVYAFSYETYITKAIENIKNTFIKKKNIVSVSKVLYSV